MDELWHSIYEEADKKKANVTRLVSDLIHPSKLFSKNAIWKLAKLELRGAELLANSNQHAGDGTAVEHHR